MLKDVIWDNAKSYGQVLKVVSIVSTPVLALMFIFSYILYTLPKNMNDNILLLVIVGDVLTFGAFLWIWMGIITYLDDNDSL